MPARRVVPYLAIAITLVGLAASAAALADALAPAPAFCAADGCAAVRASAWAKPLGIPLPVVGLGFFASLLALCLLELPRTRRAVAAAGALGALGLLALQVFAIGAWCTLCLVADLSALAVAALVVAGERAWPPLPRAPAIGVLAVAALAVAGPLAFPPGGVATPPAPPPPGGVALPEVIAREQVPGKVTVVDFIDFECPHCRALHDRLERAIDTARRAGVDVRVVRKMVPLARHPGALPAAIAWYCAERQGKGDAMADALVAAPTHQLTPDGCEQLARALGLDLTRYQQDAASDEAAAHIARDQAEARATGVRSLPTIYVGATPFVGAAASVDDLVAALTRQ